VAHALAYQRGIKDNSRQGRYHNARYRQLAEELGLEVEHDPQLGWSLTTLADDTVRGYARAIDRLERALVAYREGEHAATASSPQRGAVACVCGCGRRIRAAPNNGVLAQGPIVCGLCSTPFQPQATTARRKPRKHM
jgi:hypothetical protein